MAHFMYEVLLRIQVFGTASEDEMAQLADLQTLVSNALEVIEIKLSEFYLNKLN